MIETIIRPQDSCPEVSFCVSLFVIVSHAFDDFSGLFGHVVHLLLIVPHRGEPVHRREDADADGEGQKDEHLIPYLGTLNHDEVINALIDIGYDGYTCVEIEDKAFEGSKERVLDSVTLCYRYMRQFII